MSKSMTLSNIMNKTKSITGFALAAALTVQPLLLSAQASQLPAAPTAPATTRINPIGLPDFTVAPKFYRAYQPITIPQEALGNTPRIDQMLKDGKINLSLSDALMLAIENNLDVA